MIVSADGALDALTGPHGSGVRQWATRPLQGLDRVLDVRGTDPARRGVVRVGSSAHQAIGDATALPVGSRAVEGVSMLLVLHLLPDLDATFAELRRVLRPGGTLVLVVPSVSVRSLAELGLMAVTRPARHGPWPHRSALDHMGWLLQAADFAVLGDDRVPFALPLPDAAAAERAVSDLPAAGLWPPALDAGVRERLATELGRRAAPGRVLPVPLRRLVARR